LVDGCTPPRAFADIRNMPIDRFFCEFNVKTACHISFSVELQYRVECFLLEERRLSAIHAQKDALLREKDEEIGRLKSKALSSKDAVAEVE
jgi:hypothetical protein